MQDPVVFVLKGRKVPNKSADNQITKKQLTYSEPEGLSCPQGLYGLSNREVFT